MIRLSKLIEELQKFPGDAFVYAYEGEVTGLVIVAHPNKELGFIPAGHNKLEFEGPAVIEE